MTINKILHPKLEFSDITYGFFTRKGGYSKSPYNSLNCSFNVEDNESDVKKNLKLICNELKLEKLIKLNQIHSSKVIVVKNKDFIISNIKADGLVTKLKGVGLSVLGADCAPILFYDKISKIIGACHTGWRGAINGIIEATISSMENLGAKRTIARINNAEFIEDSSEFDLEALGVDAMISPENLASEEVKLLVNESGFTNSHDFEDGALKMMAAKIQSDAPFVGKTVMDAAMVYPGIKFMPIAIEINGERNPLVVADEAERAAAQEVINNTPQAVIDSINT